MLLDSEDYVLTSCSSSCVGHIILAGGNHASICAELISFRADWCLRFTAFEHIKIVFADIRVIIGHRDGWERHYSFLQGFVCVIDRLSLASIISLVGLLGL